MVPLEMAPFDLFDRRYRPRGRAPWASSENVAAINETLQKFMDDSFTKLRNAEGAFDLLQKFRSMPQSQEAQAKLMERKTHDILSQYDGELDHVSALFEKYHEDPPLSKNQPPLAGAINWSHSPFCASADDCQVPEMNDEMFNRKGKRSQQVCRRLEIRRYESQV